MFFKKVRKKNYDQCFLVADSVSDITQFYGFKKKFVLIEDDLDEVRFVEDLNQRRRKDAEVLSLFAANVQPGKMLDIGTHLGRSAARMAANSPNSLVYTVNIPPDDYTETGTLTTEVLPIEEIGSFYQEKKLTNIKQIFANTKTWKVPKEIYDLSLVYVDGCHDKEFVYSDTKLVLDRVKDGGFILWHDCTPIYRKNFYWIDEAMKGIEMLLRDGIITGHLINVRNSWIGIWRKEK